MATGYGMTDTLGQALVRGREDGLLGNVNANPYDRRREPKLWAQYERGYTAGKGEFTGRRVIAQLRGQQ